MAEVERQTPVTTDFSQGVNERQQPELVSSQTFTRLRNVRQRFKGAVTKRPGFTSFPITRIGAADRSSASRVYAYANGHAVIDSASLDVYSPASLAYRNVGRLPEVQATRDPVATVQQNDIAGGFFFADAGNVGATYGGLEVIIHIRNDTGASPARIVYATVYDPAENVVVVPTTLIAVVTFVATAFYPQVVVADGRAHVIYQDGTVATDLDARTLDMRDATGLAAGWGAQFKITDVTSAGMTMYDACSTGSKWALAYATAVGTIRVRLFNADGSVNTSVNLVTGAAVDAVSIGGSDAGVLWLARRVTSSAISVQALDPATLAVTCPDSTVMSTIGTITSFCVIETEGSTPAEPTGFVMTTSASAAASKHTRIVGTLGVGVAPSGTAGQHRNVHHASRPWMVADRIYCAFVLMAAGASPYHRVLVVGDISDVTGLYSTIRPVATLAPRLISTLQTDYVFGAGFVVVGRPTVRSATDIGLPIVVQRNSVASTVQMANLDYASSGRWERADASDGLHLSCGTPSFFDGQSVIEENFLAGPYIENAVVTADASGFAAPLAVTYVAVWEWTDNLGNVHRSAPGNLFQTGTFAALSKVDVDVQINYATSRLSAINAVSAIGGTWAAIYRTENGGVTYYRVAAIDMFGTGKTVTYTDKMQDSALRIREKLYRQPGESIAVQPHACPPSFTTTIAHGDRVWGVADDQRTLWYSAKRVPGEGTWFADLFQLSLELEGPITALGSSDGRLYAFKRRAIYCIDGDGPSEAGDGEFTAPYRVQGDVGCVSQRSVVNTPQGLMFQSLRGIELLSRSQQGAWVGEAVQGTLATYPTITSAVCQESAGLVLFTCTNGSTGATIVWDYMNQAWSTDHVTDGTGGGADWPAVSACISGAGLYTRVHDNGQVWSESTTSYRDGVYWVSMLAEMGWLKSSGLQGEQDIVKVSLLARSAEYHDLRIRVGYDYDTDYVDDRLYSADELSDLRTQQLEVVLSTHRSQSVRFELSDAEPAFPYTATSGTGASWIGITCNVQGRPGGVRLPQRAR